jgi:hypothetical protein
VPPGHRMGVKGRRPCAAGARAPQFASRPVPSATDAMIAAQSPSRATAAARNNAAWCDAVCRAHGGATAVDESLWVNAAPSPRFHSNLITLRPGAVAAVQEAMRMLDHRVGRHWGVKDSFAELDLHAGGFRRLFDAVWLWREARPGALTPRHGDAMSWALVAGQAELVEWERAWEPSMGDPLTAREDRPQFPPALLAQDRIAFVAGRRQGRIVAGGALNANAGVVGVSNVFAQPDDQAACWAALLGAAQERFPELPQCTYDRARPPEQPLAHGFELAGPLRVWVR